jgi:hypothetical protein
MTWWLASIARWWWFGYHSTVGILCRRRRVYAEGKPLPDWSTMTSVDAVPFLKASLGLLSFFSTCSRGNPRSYDRVLPALRCRAFLEDTVLEFTAGSSPMVV